MAPAAHACLQEFAMPLCNGCFLGNSLNGAPVSIHSWFNPLLRPRRSRAPDFMTLLFYLLPMLIGMGGAHDAAPGVRSAFVQDELVVRVPVRPRPELPTFEWGERKGPKCLELKNLRG